MVTQAAQAAIEIMARAFYAMADTRTPVLVAGAAIAVNLALCWALVGPLQQGGLALALSVAPVFFLFLFSYSLLNRTLDKWFSRPYETISRDAQELDQHVAKPRPRRVVIGQVGEARRVVQDGRWA